MEAVHVLCGIDRLRGCAVCPPCGGAVSLPLEFFPTSFGRGSNFSMTARQSSRPYWAVAVRRLSRSAWRSPISSQARDVCFSRNILRKPDFRPTITAVPVRTHPLPQGANGTSIPSTRRISVPNFRSHQVLRAVNPRAGLFPSAPTAQAQRRNSTRPHPGFFFFFLDGAGRNSKWEKITRTPPVFFAIMVN